MDGHSSGPLIARGLGAALPTPIAFATMSGTALHPVRILPFHFRFFVPMAELDLRARDWVLHAVSNVDVTARTSMLAHGGC